MEDNSLTVCALLVLLIASGYFWWQWGKLRKDLESLVEAVKRLARREPAPARLRFYNSFSKEVWRGVLNISSRNRVAERSRSTLDNVVSISSRITGVSDEITSTVEELLHILLENTGPEVLGIGIIVRDELTGELALEQLHGVPRARLNQVLLMCFDTLCGEDIDASGVTWGYQIPHPGDLFDFSVFGIGMSLSVPLKNKNGVCGGIWLGFRKGAGALSPERRAFIHAIAEHAAASFYAAKKIKAREKSINSEKDFLLAMSHDLRAPGNSALYAIRDLLSGQLGTLNSEQHLRLTIVEQALEDQLSALGDVLDFAKYQKGFLESHKKNISLADVLPRTLDSLSLTATGKGLELENEPLPNTLIEVDPKHLKRIIANFLSNAIKYTDEGSVRISFTKVSSHLEVHVSDTGIGVPPAERDLLFQEFRRCQNVKSRQGVGLGLALSKVLAELNGGYVSYKANQSGGSTFTLGAPLSASEQKDSVEPELGTIVVIDDDPAVCRSNIRYLKHIAASCVPIHTVADAIRIVEELRPDLIISDLFLQNESAEKLLMYLETRSLAIPTIIITGTGNSQLLEELRNKYRVGVIEKPVVRENLLSVVNTVLSYHTTPLRASIAN